MIFHRTPMSDFKSLDGLSIRDHYEEYRSAIEFMTGSRQKDRILAALQKNGDNSTEMLSLLHLYCQKLDVDDWELFMSIIDQIKNITDDESCWVVKIVFLALETLPRLSARLKTKICAVLKGRKNVENHFILLLSGADNVETCLEVFQAMGDEQASLFKCIMSEINTENSVLQKNIASFLVEIANNNAKLFLGFDFLDLMDSEMFVFRSCCIEILFSLIFIYKDEGNIEGINEFTETILDRLLDVNHFVRAKAVQILASLVEQQAVTLKLKNKVVENVVLRIEDKAVLVRKRALNFCTMVIKNHSFAANRYLRVERVVDEELMSEDEKAYTRDLKMFIAQMKMVISSIQDIFSCLKTEIADIVEYMKLAVFYKLDGSLGLVRFLCENIDAKQRMLLLQAFIDLFSSLKTEEDILELLDSITPNF
ncbi:Chromosome condensation complex Condensin, subunit D2 [Trachipleistophora hominis]|uniref:Chromosome condensation complex Condensin, subunit D2 n=1 Tax=Trachipleistophora hominis TaxID=72359 RepID=L7JWT1_TRAHO|nr:Chromosome condensation complex Condensin, subunit D2 [Trachipleistophora hominis]